MAVGTPQGSTWCCLAACGSCQRLTAALPASQNAMLPCRACQVAVGTPGRVCALLGSGALPPDRISVLVLDEADSLLSNSFAEDVEWVHGVLPRRKQVGMPDHGAPFQLFSSGCTASKLQSGLHVKARPGMLPSSSPALLSAAGQHMLRTLHCRGRAAC